MGNFAVSGAFRGLVSVVHFSFRAPRPKEEKGKRTRSGEEEIKRGRYIAAVASRFGAGAFFLSF